MKADALGLVNSAYSLAKDADATDGHRAHASDERPPPAPSVLVFSDADILCPADTSDDALKLAASCVVGIAKAAEKGIGVVLTAMDQLQVRMVVCGASGVTCRDFNR